MIPLQHYPQSPSPPSLPHPSPQLQRLPAGPEATLATRTTGRVLPIDLAALSVPLPLLQHHPQSTLPLSLLCTSLNLGQSFPAGSEVRQAARTPDRLTPHTLSVPPHIILNTPSPLLCHSPAPYSGRDPLVDKLPEIRPPIKMETPVQPQVTQARRPERKQNTQTTKTNPQNAYKLLETEQLKLSIQ